MYKSHIRKWPWHLLTILILMISCYFLVYAASSTAYKWSWHSVPQYFFYKATESETAPSASYVENIEKKGNQAIVTLIDYDNDESYVYTVNYADLKVNINDDLNEGDEISSSTHWAAGLLLQGLWTTLWISIVSAIISLFIGLLAGLCRLSKNPTLHDISTIYVELVRGIPLLVLIFITYFFVGNILSLSRETAAIISVSICSGAYIAEIFRGGIQSIEKGQTEAARSLGMGQTSTMCYVVLPQAIRRILPALTGQFISLIKDTSLLSIISITDLTKAGREIISSSTMPFEIWFCVAALYLIINIPLSVLAHKLEKRLAKSD